MWKQYGKSKEEKGKQPVLVFRAVQVGWTVGSYLLWQHPIEKPNNNRRETWRHPKTCDIKFPCFVCLNHKKQLISCFLCLSNTWKTWPGVRSHFFEKFTTLQVPAQKKELGVAHLPIFNYIIEPIHPISFANWTSIIPMTDPYVCHDHGNIYHQYIPNVGIYTIHGSYGISSHPSWRTPLKAWSNMLCVQSRRIRMYVCHDHGLPLTIKKYPIHASINLPYIRIRHGNDGGQHGPAWVTSLWDGGVFILRPWRGRSRPIGTYPPVDVYIAIISHRIHV